MTVTEPFPAALKERSNGKLVHHLISADSHINEPADLWTSRVAAKWRDRVPRVESFDEGDAWVEGAAADAEDDVARRRAKEVACA